jgi:hypothetical protein
MHKEINDLVEKYLPVELQDEDLPLRSKLLLGWLVEHESLLPKGPGEDLSRIVNHFLD